ncbi:MAG: hypothetical protein EZS28_007052, partial [Streblomastix strix]
MTEPKFAKPSFGKLFISGVLDGTNVVEYWNRVRPDKELQKILLTHLAIQLLGLLPAFWIVDTLFNPENESGDSQLAIFEYFRQIEPKFVYLLFFYFPWMLVSYYFSGQYCNKIAKHLRDQNPALKDQIPYKQVLEQNPKTYLEDFNYLVRVAVNWGISQIPKYSIIFENKAVGLIPYIGWTLALILGSLYSSFLSFGSSWNLLSESSIKESGLFPKGFSVHDQYCFVEVNWEYYLGWSIVLKTLTTLILPSNFASLSLGLALNAFTVPLAFIVVEREELGLNKKKEEEIKDTEITQSKIKQIIKRVDGPVSTQDGLAPFLLYNGYLPRIVSKYLIQWVDKGEVIVIEKVDQIQ